MASNTTFEERFWRKVDKDADGGCWVWKASKCRGGYGHVNRNGSYPQSHRVAYELLRGDIPVGMLLDHLCRNPSCVNPDHLEPVPPQINLLRGVGITASNAIKTHCPQGHEYTPENTNISKRNQRSCKECNKLRLREMYRLRRAEVPPIDEA
jgi:hypothetical protein